MTIVDLGRYRERRTVRRVAAVTILGAVMVGAAVRVRETWETVEHVIRWAATQLPEEGEPDAADA